MEPAPRDFSTPNSLQRFEVTANETHLPCLAAFLARCIQNLCSGRKKLYLQPTVQIQQREAASGSCCPYLMPSPPHNSHHCKHQTWVLHPVDPILTSAEAFLWQIAQEKSEKYVSHLPRASPGMRRSTKNVFGNFSNTPWACGGGGGGGGVFEARFAPTAIPQGKTKPFAVECVQSHVTRTQMSHWGCKSCCVKDILCFCSAQKPSRNRA